jgi:hypothetical protein
LSLSLRVWMCERERARESDCVCVYVHIWYGSDQLIPRARLWYWPLQCRGAGRDYEKSTLLPLQSLSLYRALTEP